MLSFSGHCHASLIVIWPGFPVFCSSFSHRLALVTGKLVWDLRCLHFFFLVVSLLLLLGNKNVSLLFLINDSARSFLYNKTTPFNDLGSTYTLCNGGWAHYDTLLTLNVSLIP